MFQNLELIVVQFQGWLVFSFLAVKKTVVKYTLLNKGDILCLFRFPLRRSSKLVNEATKRKELNHIEGIESVESDNDNLTLENNSNTQLESGYFLNNEIRK